MAKTNTIDSGYNGNILLKKDNTPIEWTEELLKEYHKCSEDPVYFIESYMKIIHVDLGLIPFKLHDFQHDMIQSMKDNRETIITTARQVGKCLFYDTKINVRPAKHSKSFINNYSVSTTIGEFYDSMQAMSENVPLNQEKHNLLFTRMSSSILCDKSEQEKICRKSPGKRLYNLQDMWLSCCSFIWTFKFAQYFYRSLPTKIQLRNLLRDIFKKCISEFIWRKESWMETWWKIESLLQEFYSQRSLQPIFACQESKGYSQRKFQRFYNDRLLYQERVISRRSKESSFEATNNFFAGEMYPEIWAERGNCSLVSSSRKMDKNFERKINRRENCYQQKENDFNWFNFKNGKRNSPFIRKKEFSNRNTKDFIRFFWQEFCLRYLNWQQNNRIQWGLLALQSNKVCSNILQQIYEENSRRNLETRQNENFSSKFSGLQNISNLGTGLQGQQGKYYRKNSKLSDTVTRKFINSIDLSDYEIETDFGWVPLTQIHKTIPYTEWIIKTESGKELIAADNHILFDENHQEIFLKDCIPGQTKIITKNGLELVTSVIETSNKSNMYDLSVDSEDHSFYSNDILSHNSTTTCGFILWYILFQSEKTVALLANKGETAREILGKIKLAYQHLPKWLQQGILVWNEGSIELENNSRVIASATSSDAIRGYSINCVSAKTKITIRDKVTNTIKHINIDEFKDLEGVQKENDREMRIYISND